jgi:transcriptional regulator GlxA family with amidase domain
MLAEASRSKISSREKNFPQRLKETRDFLHDNFAESFALETVAKIAGVHRRIFSACFVKNFGCTVGEYVSHLRVEYASRQILTTQMPLSEVPSNAGFSDQSHFNRIFKNLFNLTPYEY